MHDYDNIVRERQKAIRRQIEQRQISITAIYLDAGYETSSSILSYFPANKDAKPAVMSAAALFRLLDREALPPELLSMLLPDGFMVVRVPENVDHDEADRACREFSAAKAAAHHPESEAGREIGPNEDKALRAKLTLIQGSVAA